jgi:transposase
MDRLATARFRLNPGSNGQPRRLGRLRPRWPPRRWPERITADRGYDHDNRRELRRYLIAPEIARRQTEHGSGLGRARWVVERTFAWLHHFKRLLVRYDRRAEIHEGFLALG